MNGYWEIKMAAVSSSSTFMEPVSFALLDKFFMTELFLIDY